jgi:hypothetical protein
MLLHVLHLNFVFQLENIVVLTNKRLLSDV